MNKEILITELEKKFGNQIPLNYYYMTKVIHRGKIKVAQSNFYQTNAHILNKFHKPISKI